MRYTKVILVGFAVVVLIAATASGADNRDLRHRHGIGLNLGGWSQSTGSRSAVGAGSVVASVDAGGGFGSLWYAHWVRENLALQANVGGMFAGVDAKIELGDMATSTVSVTHILAGIKYYFPAETFGSSVRPFVSAQAGPFIAHMSRSTFNGGVVYESISEAAAGGQLAAGLDIQVSRRFITNINAGYNFMSDFDRAVGGSRNYSGPVFSFGVGLMLGRSY